MLNLNSTIDLDFKEFFLWWKRELGFLVPEKIKQLVNDKRGFIIASLEGRELVLTYLNNGQVKSLTLPERGARDLTFQRLCEKDEIGRASCRERV